MTSTRSTFAIWGLRSGTSQPIRTNRIMLCVIASMATAGCQRDPMPADVRKMAAVEFPDDNKIHVQKRGTVQIKPTTKFCMFRGSLGLDGIVLRDFIERHDQSTYIVGAVRTNGIINDSPGCDQPGVVIVHGYQTENKYGRPYKLVLTIWQDDAAWVGIVSRRNGARPGVTVAPVGATPAFKDFNRERLLRNSIHIDQKDLSSTFLKNAEWSDK